MESKGKERKTKVSLYVSEKTKDFIEKNLGDIGGFTAITNEALNWVTVLYGAKVYLALKEHAHEKRAELENDRESSAIYEIEGNIIAQALAVYLRLEKEGVIDKAELLKPKDRSISGFIASCLQERMQELENE